MIERQVLFHLKFWALHLLRSLVLQISDWFSLSNGPRCPRRKKNEPVNRPVLISCSSSARTESTVASACR